VALLFVSLLAGALVYLVRHQGILDPRISRANFARLAEGLSEREVEDVLGPPISIDDSARPALTGPWERRYELDPKTYPRRFFWRQRGQVIWVDFLDGRARRFGATLDGQRIGEDPERVKITEAYRQEGGGGD
jgi:hypothetical protein